MTTPNCPSCGMSLVVCDHPKCGTSPHLICSEHGGCGYVVKASRQEIANLKFADAIA